MNAPFLRPGTITIQWALSRRSVGMPLSGASMISENTAAASVKRSRSFSSAESGLTVKGEMATVEIIAAVAKKDRNLGIIASRQARMQFKHHPTQNPPLALQ